MNETRKMLRMLMMALAALSLTFSVVACDDDDGEDVGDTVTDTSSDTGGTDTNTDDTDETDTNADDTDETDTNTDDTTEGDTSTGDVDDDTSTGDVDDDATDVDDDATDVDDDMTVEDVTDTTDDTSDMPSAVAMCSEAGLEGCFENADCQASERCEDIGSTAVEVPCCVMGARGTGQPGDVCETENDCESGLCVEDANGSACTQSCMGDGDCPANLPSCSIVGVCRPE